MNDQYQYFEQRLIPSIAQELIEELLGEEPLKRQELIRRVDKAHEERGGHLAIG